jgi:hypothetical protein
LIGVVIDASQSFAISAAAVKQLFFQIPFPSPYTDASTFEVDYIMECLEKNESEIRQGFADELVSVCLFATLSSTREATENGINSSFLCVKCFFHVISDTTRPNLCFPYA